MDALAFEDAHRNVCKRHGVRYFKNETDMQLADRICLNKGYIDKNLKVIGYNYINIGYINIDIFEEHESYRLWKKLMFDKW